MIVKNEKGEIIAHRTCFKVLLNPILRKLGWSISTVLDGEKVKGYKILPYPEYNKILEE